MIKTQIYLDENVYTYLQEQSAIAHKSISEFITESVEEKMNRNTENILKATENIFGIWKDKKFDVDDYIREMRRDRIL